MENSNRVLNIKNYESDSYRRAYAFIVGYNVVPEVVNAKDIQYSGIDVLREGLNSIIDGGNVSRYFFFTKRIQEQESFSRKILLKRQKAR